MSCSSRNIILINYTGRRGGGALNAFEMAKALVENGNRVAAVISKETENLTAWKRLALEKLVIIPTYTSALSFAASHLRFLIYKKYSVRKQLRGYCIKTIYCPMCTFWTLPINRLFPQAKVITALHDPIPHTGETYLLANQFFRVDRNYRDADEIIVHTKRFLSYVERRYQKYGHVHYLPLGRYDFYRRIRKKRIAIRYAKEKTNFVFFGRISPYKGLDVLADAYESIERTYHAVTLSVVGSGDFRPYREKYEKCENVTVINRWIADDEVESVFTGENLIAVLPYKDATQSGVVLTAMDCGVPVIAADAGGIREQITDGVTGLLVPPDDSRKLAQCMVKLMNDKKLYRRLCTNIRKRQKEREWTSIAKKLMDIAQI